MNRTVKQLLRLHLLIIGSMGLCVFILYVFGIGCPIRRITHIPCPGCGLTRAWVQCFSLDFVGAFHYHPLFLLAPILFILGVHRGTRVCRKISLKVQDGILIVSGILFIVVYCIRIFIFKSTFI